MTLSILEDAERMAETDSGERHEAGEKLNTVTKIESLCEWNNKAMYMKEKSVGRRREP